MNRLKKNLGNGLSSVDSMEYQRGEAGVEILDDSAWGFSDSDVPADEIEEG